MAAERAGQWAAFWSRHCGTQAVPSAWEGRQQQNLGARSACLVMHSGTWRRLLSWLSPSDSRQLAAYIGAPSRFDRSCLNSPPAGIPSGLHITFSALARRARGWVPAPLRMQTLPTAHTSWAHSERLRHAPAGATYRAGTRPLAQELPLPLLRATRNRLRRTFVALNHTSDGTYF